MDAREINYVAPPTLAKFHQSGSFIRCVIGPIGSGKTFAMIMELMRRSAEQAPGVDGIRRTRWAIVRNTLQQLKTTILLDIQAALGPIAQFHVSTNTVRIRTGEIESDWILTPLDTPDDQRRLLSLQLTGAWISECREVDFSLLAAIAGRVGRYPSKMDGGPTWFGVIMESNPWSDGSPWCEYFEIERPAGVALFRQPSGLSAEAENKVNLPPDYYERLASTHGEEWVKVHVHGLNGDDLSGQAVFKSSFSIQRHVSREALSPNSMRPIMIGMDFGRTPTALITQVDPRGRLLIFKEVHSDDMGLRQFLREKLRPVLYEDRFAGARVFVVADPAGRIKSQAGEETLFDVLRDERFDAVPASTNDISMRLVTAERLMLENRGDTPALMIDEEGCPMLIRALATEYKYKRRKTGEVDDKPDKAHPWSDLADAFQYACLGMNSNLPGRVMKRAERRAERREPMPAGAWT